MRACSTMDQICLLGSRGITVDALLDFTISHPAILLPAFTIQTKLQRNSLGEHFWKSYSAKRLQLSNGQHITISQLKVCYSHSLHNIINNKKLYYLHNNIY